MAHHPGAIIAEHFDLGRSRKFFSGPWKKKTDRPGGGRPLCRFCLRNLQSTVLCTATHSLSIGPDGCCSVGGASSLQFQSEYQSHPPPNLHHRRGRHTYTGTRRRPPCRAVQRAASAAPRAAAAAARSSRRRQGRRAGQARPRRWTGCPRRRPPRRCWWRSSPCPARRWRRWRCPSTSASGRWSCATRRPCTTWGRRSSTPSPSRSSTAPGTPSR